MTMTMPPHTPAQRRAIPRLHTHARSAHIEKLLHQDQGWVLRGDWERYLDNGDEGVLVPIDGLTRDQRTAAMAWLRQQRHPLHEIVEGGLRAPEGWLERLPLYAALTHDDSPVFSDRPVISPWR